MSNSLLKSKIKASYRVQQCPVEVVHLGRLNHVTTKFATCTGTRTFCRGSHVATVTGVLRLDDNDAIRTWLVVDTMALSPAYNGGTPG